MKLSFYTDVIITCIIEKITQTHA